MSGLIFQCQCSGNAAMTIHTEVIKPTAGCYEVQAEKLVRPEKCVCVCVCVCLHTRTHTCYTLCTRTHVFVCLLYVSHGSNNERRAGRELVAESSHLPEDCEMRCADVRYGSKWQISLCEWMQLLPQRIEQVVKDGAPLWPSKDKQYG